MKDLDFIRYLIDLVDQNQSGKEQLNDDDDNSPESDAAPTTHHPQNAYSQLHDVTKDKEQTNDPNPQDIKNAMDSEDIFIPPLQQRIEMLKKLTGVNPKDREILSHIDGDDPTAS